MKIEADDAGTDEKLEYPSCRDDWRQSQFHECAFIGGEYDSHPVEGIAAFRSEHPIDWYLAAYEVDEECDGRVQNLFLIVDEAVGLVDEGEEFDGGLKDVEHSEAHLVDMNI